MENAAADHPQQVIRQLELKLVVLTHLVAQRSKPQQCGGALYKHVASVEDPLHIVCQLVGVQLHHQPLLVLARGLPHALQFSAGPRLGVLHTISFFNESLVAEFLDSLCADLGSLAVGSLNIKNSCVFGLGYAQLVIHRVYIYILLQRYE